MVIVFLWVKRKFSVNFSCKKAKILSLKRNKILTYSLKRFAFP